MQAVGAFIYQDHQGQTILIAATIYDGQGRQHTFVYDDAEETEREFKARMMNMAFMTDKEGRNG